MRCSTRSVRWLSSTADKLSGGFAPYCPIRVRGDPFQTQIPRRDRVRTRHCATAPGALRTEKNLSHEVHGAQEPCPAAWSSIRSRGSGCDVANASTAPGGSISGMLQGRTSSRTFSRQQRCHASGSRGTLSGPTHRERTGGLSSPLARPSHPCWGRTARRSDARRCQGTWNEAGRSQYQRKDPRSPRRNRSRKGDHKLAGAIDKCDLAPLFVPALRCWIDLR